MKGMNVVEINKEDLENSIKGFNKIYEVHSNTVIYGRCYIISEDLTSEELQGLFPGSTQKNFRGAKK